MRSALGTLLLLAGCTHAATTTTPPVPPTPPAPMRGQLVSLEIGSGAGGDDLKVVVSFRNDGSGTCAVTSYALAWGHSPGAARHTCAQPVSIGPNATAVATCMIPSSSPMRDAAGRTEAEMEVVDVVASCQASK